jgi:hypothetical protein
MSGETMARAEVSSEFSERVMRHRLGPFLEVFRHD